MELLLHLITLTCSTSPWQPKSTSLLDTEHSLEKLRKRFFCCFQGLDSPGLYKLEHLTLHSHPWQEVLHLQLDFSWKILFLYHIFYTRIT